LAAAGLTARLAARLAAGGADAPGTTVLDAVDVAVVAVVSAVPAVVAVAVDALAAEPRPWRAQ